MEIKNVFVVGAGAMGSGIAQVCVVAGYNVKMFDANAEQMEKAKSSITKRLESSVNKGKMTAQEFEAVMLRLQLAQSLGDAYDSELVIEAATERMEIKKSIFAQLNTICSKDCILASNTSSLSITERFVGMHFFNPVPVMKLLEVVSGLRTSQETLDAVKEFGEKIQKIMISAKDSPAFLVSRTLNVMLNEAVILLEEGKGSVEDIDAGLVYGCGHPMGPLTLIDLVGVDVTLAVTEVLYKELGDSKYRPATLLKNMVRAGLLGKKTGQGFYVYDENGGQKPNPIFSRN